MRTPKKIIDLAKNFFDENQVIILDVDKKAYLSSLKLADHIVVTCDSTSMISDGKSFYSVSGINNNFSYSLLNNLTLNGNVGLFIMQSPLKNQNPLIEQLSIAYDASITYQPFKNSILQFRVQKIPHQKNYFPIYKGFNQ